jgi:signal transduction histidine kinase
MAFRGFLVRTGAFSLLLCAGLFWFSYRTLGGVDRQLSETQERLQRESAIQAETNRQLHVEVAERRRAQLELVGLNDHLEQRVAERTGELKQLNQEIEGNRRALEAAYKELQDKQATILHQDKMACIGQLAAGVAHDINNPVGFVSSNLKALERYFGRLTQYVDVLEASIQSCGTTDERMQASEKRRELKIDHHLQDLPELVADCLEGTERVGKIVQNLRSFSRNDAPERRLADLHECLDSTITIIANELRHKATVTREYGDIPLLICDPQQLNQVFMNLLINAAQAIEREGEIRIRTWSEEGAVCVSISDTGCGIPADKLSKIFEPFFTTKDVGQGTGLGLSIVYDLVRRHDGEIAAQSQPGQGSVFTLRLPLGEVAAQHG